MSPARGGAVLIVVSGLAAMLVALAVGFLVRMRLDVEESSLLLREAQARVMLAAALMYVQETSRIGWDRGATAEREEAYGWVDVRDGSPGPKDRRHVQLAAMDPVTGLGAAFPAVGGRAARCPMARMRRPPSAVEATVNYNPIPNSWQAAMPPEPIEDWDTREFLWRDLISYRQPEPRAAAADAGSWRRGDPRPVGATARSWFRVYRPTRQDCDAHRDVHGAAAPILWTPGVFIVTCGAGATGGWRDWDEVVEAGATDEFGDPARFAELRAQESILWYACEWNPAQGYNGTHHYDNNWLQQISNYHNRIYTKAFGGTLLWVERLVHRPARW